MNKKRAFLATMLAGAASVAGAAGAIMGQQVRFARDRPFSLDGATGWLNSPPLTAASLRGRVVLIDFWTYSCINWRREFPFVRAWSAKYKDHGLVVIGVHSPEFAFEKDFEKVKRAVTEIGVPYPVAVDSEHAIWRAFGNAHWPALYFIDAQGRLQHSHFGEGDYDRSERMIQKLLAKAGSVDAPTDLVIPAASGPELEADWENIKSPETYVGFARRSNLASAGATLGKPRSYEVPTRLGHNQWALAGGWTLQDEAAVLNSANGRIVFNFHARDLHLVMGPSARTGAVQFRILLDGKPPGPARGVDVDEHGRGTLAEHRMYQLVRQPRPIQDRRFEIEFLASGAEVFSFTFG